MILTQVYVPSVSKYYTFRLDETATIEAVIVELAELICQKEQCQFVGNKNDLILCTYNTGGNMQNDKTLEDYGITDGEKLILV